MQYTIYWCRVCSVKTNSKLHLPSYNINSKLHLPSYKYNSTKAYYSVNSETQCACLILLYPGFLILYAVGGHKVLEQCKIYHRPIYPVYKSKMLAHMFRKTQKVLACNFVPKGV